MAPSGKRFALVTDFGCQGPYLGQLHAVLGVHAETVPVIDLLSDAPFCNPRASAYLVAALSGCMPEGTIFIAVVDPGVGGARAGLVVESERHIFVGPDNGLLARVAQQSAGCRVWKIGWTPPQCSATFHGRDLFAPVAARLATGEPFRRTPVAVEQMVGFDWPEDLYECIYVDHYGNVYTGIQGGGIDPGAVVRIGPNSISHARTFSDRAPGELFWYVNSCGLVEIAANLGRADQRLRMKIGDAVALAV